MGPGVTRVNLGGVCLVLLFVRLASGQMPTCMHHLRRLLAVAGTEQVEGVAAEIVQGLRGRGLLGMGRGGQPE